MSQSFTFKYQVNWSYTFFTSCAKGSWMVLVPQASDMLTKCGCSSNFLQSLRCLIAIHHPPICFHKSVLKYLITSLLVKNSELCLQFYKDHLIIFLTISHRRRCEYRQIVTEMKSRWLSRYSQSLRWLSVLVKIIALVIIRENKTKTAQFVTLKHQQIWPPFWKLKAVIAIISACHFQ